MRVDTATPRQVRMSQRLLNVVEGDASLEPAAAGLVAEIVEVQIDLT